MRDRYHSTHRKGDCTFQLFQGETFPSSIEKLVTFGSGNTTSPDMHSRTLVTGILALSPYSPCSYL